MELDPIEIVQLELKYCERCGSLWLRPIGARAVYCAACVPKIADLPAPAFIALPRHDDAPVPASWYGEGGNA